MPWLGGTFTRTNGTYSGGSVWQSDAAAAIKIRADRHDTHDQDLASGINNTLTKDGQNSPTTHMNWGGFRLTNLGNPVNAQDAMTKTYADSTYVAKSGDTMTGQLNVSYANAKEVIYDTGPGAGGNGGLLSLEGKNAGGTQVVFSQVKGYLTDGTIGAEHAECRVSCMVNGVLQPTGLFGSAGRLRLQDPTPVAVGVGGGVDLSGSNNVGSQVVLARVKGYLDDGTAGAESSSMQFFTRLSGVTAVGMTLDFSKKLTVGGSLQFGGGFTLSKVTVSNAAPGVLAQGEIYFRTA